MPVYLRPQTLDEALGALRDHPDLRIVAGGTDVYPALGQASGRVSMLDLAGVSALGGVALGSDGLRIGALATWADLCRAGLPSGFDALLEAGREVGSSQIQNAATVVGNVCNASPAADGTVALLALDARVEIAGPGGLRRVALADFVTGVRRVALAPDELVTALHLPRPRGRSRFLKLGARRYLVISIAMVAALIERGADGAIARAAVAVGACSPVAARLPGLEAQLVGARRADLAGLVRGADFSALSPISDVRAEAAYRSAVAPVLVRRVLEACLEDADE
ncbi:MAG: FAD binding domain-containing protein [Pararhodobacter sp.]